MLLLNQYDAYQNTYNKFTFLETSNWLLSFNQFQFGTLYHFRRHYIIGGSSSELIRLKEDRAREAQVR